MMKNTIFYLLALCLLQSIASLDAQDVKFSQFENSPLYLNPALTGIFNGEHRVLLNYRNQGADILRGDSYQATALSYDTQIILSESDYFGLGINGIYEKAGALELGTKQALISSSYRRRIISDSIIHHFLAVGMQYGVVNRHVDLTDARWASQHDGSGGFDPTDPPGEINDTEFVHGDFSAGLLWESILGNRSSFRLGIAMHHLNKANISFLDNDSNLTIRTSIHGSAEAKLSSKISLLPSFLHLSQGLHDLTMVGFSGRLYFNREHLSNFIQIGAWKWFRSNSSNLDTYTFSGMLRLENFIIGISYDHFTTKFTGADRLWQAYEISFGYIFKPY